MSIFINKQLWEQIGSKTGWLSSDIVRTAEVEYDQILVDMNEKPVAIPAGTKKRINNALYNLGNYHNYIPFDDIRQIFESNDCVIIQEDGTKWSGFIAPTGYCGETNPDGSSKNQPMMFDIAIKNGDEYKRANVSLTMTVCKMPSGKLEIVAYV